MHLQTLDIVGSILKFLATLLFVRVNIVAWPISLFASVSDMTLYFRNQIYADAVLSLIYFIFTFYGWYQWHGNRDKGIAPLPISHLSRPLFLKLMGIGTLGTAFTLFF